MTKLLTIASSKAMNRVHSGNFQAKYPWRTMGIGQSFFLEPHEIKLASLRALASATGKKLGKKFAVVVWRDKNDLLKGYEVARTS